MPLNLTKIEDLRLQIFHFCKGIFRQKEHFPESLKFTGEGGRNFLLHSKPRHHWFGPRSLCRAIINSLSESVGICDGVMLRSAAVAVAAGVVKRHHRSMTIAAAVTSPLCVNCLVCTGSTLSTPPTTSTYVRYGRILATVTRTKTKIIGLHFKRTWSGIFTLNKNES